MTESSPPNNDLQLCSQEATSDQEGLEDALLEEQKAEFELLQVISVQLKDLFSKSIRHPPPRRALSEISPPNPTVPRGVRSQSTSDAPNYVPTLKSALKKAQASSASKSVTFAHDLVAVRNISPNPMIPEAAPPMFRPIPVKEYKPPRVLYFLDETEVPFLVAPIPDEGMNTFDWRCGSFFKTERIRPWRRIKPMFQPRSPREFIDIFSVNKICLGQYSTTKKNIILGVVWVTNLVECKTVYVRYTKNHWKSQRDEALLPYGRQLSLHQNLAQVCSASPYWLEIDAGNLAVGQEVELALKLQIWNREMTQGWDNNLGQNYRLKCFATTEPVSIPKDPSVRRRSGHTRAIMIPKKSNDMSEF